MGEVKEPPVKVTKYHYPPFNRVEELTWKTQKHKTEAKTKTCNDMKFNFRSNQDQREERFLETLSFPRMVSIFVHFL